MNTRLSYRFPKAARLRARRDFQRIARGYSRKTGQWITMDIRQGKAIRPRLGITVTRKYGKAHDRNRFKRVVREAFRHCQHQLPIDLEVNVRPRSPTMERIKSTDVMNDLLQLTNFILNKH